MHYAIRLCVAILVLGGAVRPAAAASQTAQTDTQAALSIEQAREAYISSGFNLDRTLSWDWTSPPVQTFRVHDAGNDRVLMVFVYSSSAAAQDARAQALANQQVSDASPRLVDGFGASTWRNNVALVEARQSALDRRYRSDAWRTIGMPGGGDVGPSRLQAEMVVDVDFQQALTPGSAS